MVAADPRTLLPLIGSVAMPRKLRNHRELIRRQRALAGATRNRLQSAPAWRCLARLAAAVRHVGHSGLFGLFGLFAFLALTACTYDTATENDCDVILTQIVELEIREQGYRDPALVERKQAQLRRTFTEEIARCVGRRLPKGAMKCIATASSAEEISHACLR